MDELYKYFLLLFKYSGKILINVLFLAFETKSDELDKFF
jgi:hypothetical protein